MKLRRLTILAMLIAMNVVLCFMTPIKLDNFKFTFEAFPILVAGLLYGPSAGFTVGFLGSFIYQLLSYGFMATTLLWVMPHALSGFVVGLYSYSRNYHHNFTSVVTISIISALTVTVFNTLAMYLASKFEGWYTPQYVFGTLIYRFLAGIIMAVLFSLILPKLLEQLRKLDK